MNIKINNKKIVCKKGETILQVAERAGVEIPSLCHHPDFAPKGNCRVCVVEVKGWRRLVTSCSTEVQDGMEVLTESPRVKKARNANIELIYAEHIEKCSSCVLQPNCKLLDFAKKYKLLINTYKDRKANRKIFKFANAVELDSTQCIDCRNCLDACAMQKINYLELKGKGNKQEIVPTIDKNIDCIYCGQCALHCPVTSAQEQTSWEEVGQIIEKGEKVIVAQFAPSIRVSIGEEFGMPHGKIVTGQIVTALKDLGFNYVFDVNFAADVTTMVEAEELLERVKTGGTMPMFTSCCPSWVKYVEFYHPELIPNLTTSRSPQIHNGGIIKTYWAQKMKINPKDIVVVSIMPCTSKKFEASREEMKIAGNLPVDYVLTTREFAWMMRKKNIDFPKLKAQKADNPMGEYSGAAAIYGGSGGVMESALRTAQFLACGDKKASLCKQRLEFKQVRGLEGIKEAEVDVAGIKVRVAVVNGIGNVGPVLENIKNYDYIEVMSCPGGCIGGGGQPIPTTKEIRQKRIQALYKLDKDSKIRKAHDNEQVQEILVWLKDQGKLEHTVLHTKYQKRKRK